MSDKLTELLHERFNGHEMDLPPGTWEHVSGQLATASGESLRESLQDKFRGHEVKVDPSVWANISGQLGHVATTGISIATNWLAAGVGVMVMTTALLIWNAEGNTAQVEVPAKPQVVVAEVRTAKPSETSTITAIPEAPKTAHVQEPVHDRVKPVTTLPAVGQQATPPVQAPVPKIEAGREQVTESPVAPTATKASDNAPAPEKPTDNKPAAPTPSTAQVPISITNTGTQNHPALDGGSETVNETPDNGQAPTDPFQKADDSNISIPTAFTPNGDGKNDVWKVIAPDCSKVEVTIASASSGNVVYRSTNLNEGWDGRLSNGNIAEEGSYVYVVLLTDKEGRSLAPRKGVVTLYR